VAPQRPTLSKRWDRVAFGTEIGTAYSKLTDLLDQRRRLTAQALAATASRHPAPSGDGRTGQFLGSHLAERLVRRGAAKCSTPNIGVPQYCGWLLLCVLRHWRAT